MTVPPPTLKYIKTPEEAFVDFMGLKPLPIIGAIVLGIGGLGVVLRNWWLSGRDRWHGDVHYLVGHDTAQNPKPLFAKETVVVEYTPPEVGKEKRPMRPAEIGLLLDERADTLDVTATIIDLAVRDYLRIEQVEGEGLFGKDDYILHRLKESDDSAADLRAAAARRPLRGRRDRQDERPQEQVLRRPREGEGVALQPGRDEEQVLPPQPGQRCAPATSSAASSLAGLGVAVFVGLGILQIGAHPRRADHHRRPACLPPFARRCRDAPAPAASSTAAASASASTW